LRRYSAEGALVLAALLFGVTFPLVHDALVDVTPFAYLLVRFAVAFVALVPFAIVVARSKGEDRRLLVRVGAFAGVLLFGGYALQTIGLQYTSPSASAFITGLYVVFTPVVESIVRRHAPPLVVWVGIAVATAGLLLLTGADVGIGRGELYTLGCAAAFAIWIVYQGAYANRLHAVTFSTMQIAMVAALCVPATAAQGTGRFTGLAVFAAVFTGIACSSGALSLQLYGQRRIAPSRAALILLCEPVFAAVAGYADGDRLDALQLVGAAVILAGIAIAELGPGRATTAPEHAAAEHDLAAHLPTP
jgi:drug/metabolite transporter (DMT)-like permease